MAKIDLAVELTEVVADDAPGGREVSRILVDRSGLTTDQVCARVRWF